ncbi:hypothetical protein [Vibrio metschnikovii]|uniref:hypothetical protein n=1 Tax=Vibrio metschnikovii TaxID=28172 RepID=UPI001C30ECAE|nr:hypothetical protein [Vibrio metschnikovii]
MKNQHIHKLMDKARTYESFINSKLANKTQVNREYLESTLKQEAQAKFPELRHYHNNGKLVVPDDLKLFSNVLNTMIDKMGFKLVTENNMGLTPHGLRQRFNPDRS